MRPFRTLSFGHFVETFLVLTIIAAAIFIGHLATKTFSAGPPKYTDIVVSTWPHSNTVTCCLMQEPWGKKRRVSDWLDFLLQREVSEEALCQLHVIILWSLIINNLQATNISFPAASYHNCKTLCVTCVTDWCFPSINECHSHRYPTKIQIPKEKPLFLPFSLG